MAARTTVTASRFPLGDVMGDMSENAVAIDQPNGMRVVVNSKVDRVAIRITNTSASTRVVTVKAAPGAGNPRGVYGAAGPGGSFPTEPDYTSVAIPATTGVRWLAPPNRYFQGSDGSIWLDFVAGHTGTVSAVESA